jgi:predicted O-methyltransferase YrrM
MTGRSFLQRVKEVSRRARLALAAGLDGNDLSSFGIPSGLGDSAWVLHGLVRAMKPRMVVEIGSASGFSTCVIGSALRANGEGRLVAIDPHIATDWNDEGPADTFGALTRNLRRAGVTEFVEVIRGNSADVALNWQKPIDLLFIDGDHSYEGVKHDWTAFSRFVSDFGVVVFHDALWDLRPVPQYARPHMGVPRFVDELRVAGFPVVTLERDFGLSLVQPRRGGVPLSSA